MTDLASLSVARAGLPSFPGATLPDQMAAGRAAAEAILRKYVPNFAFSDAARDQVMAEIEVWEERNQVALSAAMQDATAETLPSAVQTAFGVQATQQFILGGFTRAAAGLGPWSGGAVKTAVDGGGAVNQSWAEDDAANRLVVFGSIVKMEQDGYLAGIFAPGATSGFGIPLAVAALFVIALVAVAAVIVAYFYSAQKLQVNNRLMAQLCTEAQKNGDQATVAACIQATKDLQNEASPTTQLIDGVVKIGLVVGGLWAILKWGPDFFRKTRAA